MNFATRFTAMMATWTFIIVFLVLCILEIVWNHTPAVTYHHWDFDPTTIILNLMLSLWAAVQGSIVMISQKQQEKHLLEMISVILQLVQANQTHNERESENSKQIAKHLMILTDYVRTKEGNDEEKVTVD